MTETLAPLASIAELPTHPTLSRPYLSDALTKLTQEALNLLQKEKDALWRMKQLLTTFRGDETWVPCGALETDQDARLFGGNPTQPQRDPFHSKESERRGTSPRDQRHENNGQMRAGDERPQKPASTDKEPSPKNEHLDKAASHDTVKDVEDQKNKGSEGVPEVSKVEETGEGLDGQKLVEAELRHDSPGRATTSDNKDGAVDQQAAVTANGVEQKAGDDADKDTDVIMSSLSSPQPANEKTTKLNGKAETEADEKQVGEEGGGGGGGNGAQPPAHRMTTRRQAQAASDNTTSAQTRSASPGLSRPSSTTNTSTSTTTSATNNNQKHQEQHRIHPIFLVPASAHPDRDFGLPATEAEDTRKLLLHYVQKQEEVCRGSLKLYEGLVRADRLRKTVLGWAKAEAHVGEMSDGEDWYDKVEWGLADDDLKKGHDEDDPDDIPGGNTTAVAGTAAAAAAAAHHHHHHQAGGGGITGLGGAGAGTGTSTASGGGGKKTRTRRA